MTNTALRIASITYVLKDLLNDKLINHNVSGITGTSVIVTALSPDKIDTSTDHEQSQLNLFMYQATLNQGWKNIGLPSFNGNGDRVNNPPLAVDLHYLLTAYGSQEFHTDILLGYGMQLLHETPVLDRKAIGTSIAGTSADTTTVLPQALRTLSDSALADQVEMITITPEILSIEDISKLWAAFATKYRPTAAYKVTVVLIESNKSIKSGPPVETRNVYTIPIKKPKIENVSSQSAAGQPIVEDQKILSSYFIVLKGSDFYAEKTQVTLNDKTVPATSSLNIQDSQISFQLTDDLNLKAGTHTVVVVQPMILGKDTTPQHKGTSSEPATFALCSQIQSITPNPITIPPNGSANVTIKVKPKLFPGQKVILLLNAVTPAADGSYPAYSFQTSLPTIIANPLAVPTDSITIPIAGVVKGQFAVRIQVDGAESPIDFPLGSKPTEVITIQ